MHKTFQFSSQGVNLQMRVDFSKEKSSKFVLYFPGVSGNAISKRTDELANTFAQEGYNFVRFEYRCYLENEKFGNSSLKSDHADIKNALDFLELNFPNSRYGAVAKSLGGLRLLSFSMLDRFECIGLLAPAVFVGDENTIKSFSDINYDSISKIDDFRITIRDLEKINSPTIFIHGGNDSTVPFSNSELLISHFANSNNKLVRIESANHSFDNENEDNILCIETVKFFVENCTCKLIAVQSSQSSGVLKSNATFSLHKNFMGSEVV